MKMEQNWWEARLRPEGPNYAKWKLILGDLADQIPLISPLPMEAILGDETLEIYLIDWQELGSDASQYIIEIVMNQLGLSEIDANKYMDIRGSYPIRTVDVEITSKIQSWI
jgi:hypothetical protein